MKRGIITSTRLGVWPSLGRPSREAASSLARRASLTWWRVCGVFVCLGLSACSSAASTDPIRSEVANSLASTSAPPDVTTESASTALTCPEALDVFGSAETAIHEELNMQPYTGAPPQVPEPMVARLFQATRDLESQCEIPNVFDFTVPPSELLDCLGYEPDPAATEAPGYRLFPAMCEVTMTMVVPGVSVSTDTASADTSAGPLTVNASHDFEQCRVALTKFQPVGEAVESAFLSQSAGRYDGVVEVSDRYVQQLTSLTLNVQAACEDSGVIDSVRGAPATAPSDLAACLVPGVVTYSCGRSLVVLNMYARAVLR